MKLQMDLPEDHRGAMRPDPNRPPTRKEFWEFYDFLRSTGKTNMMGAPKYAEFYLDVTKKQAEEAFWDWVNLFKKSERLEALLDS